MHQQFSNFFSLTRRFLVFILYRYFLRVTCARRITDMTKEMDILVHTMSAFPEMNNPIKMEVGIEECLHIEFEYNKSKWVLRNLVFLKPFWKALCNPRLYPSHTEFWNCCLKGHKGLPILQGHFDLRCIYLKSQELCSAFLHVLYKDYIWILRTSILLSRYHLKDVIVGKIYFLLVRIKIKHMEVAIIKRETTGTGPNILVDSETIAK